MTQCGWLVRVWALGAILCAGCSPVSLTVTLFADNSRLEEMEVDHDKGAGEAKVAIIDVRGLIADKGEGLLLGRGTNPVDDLTARLQKARDDQSVKAVILRINSPGGTVTASDVMYREVRRFAAESGKPVVASLDEIAASGGYFLALSSDYIVAEPTSITGSIGVIIPTINVSEGLGKIGIKSRSIVSRPNKDLGNPLEPMKEEHYKILQTLVDDFYGRFRSLVIERRTHGGATTAEGTTGGGAVTFRNIDMARIDELTDGRVMSGTRALDAGLVDATGGVRDAFTIAKTMAGVKAARLMKYYREDADKPRSPYAASGVPPAEGSEINVFQLRMNRGLLGNAESAGAYYLWLPPGE